MNAPSTSAIERRLLALDHEELVAFIAALWRECGWAVDRNGPVLEVTLQGESKRLLVLPPRRIAPRLRAAPQVQGSVDEIVSPLAGTDDAALPRGTPELPVIDATAIRERLWYAVDVEDRERLLADHLGIRSVSGGPVRGTSGRQFVIPPLRVPRRAGSTLASVGVLLVLVGLAIVLVATGVPFGDSTTGTANASEPQSTGSYATASAAVYEAKQTCERGPGGIATLTTSATRGSSVSHGLVVLGEFWNPGHVRTMPSRAWREMMTTEAHRAFYDAESVRLDDPVIDGDEATVTAIATIDGEEREYRYAFGRADTNAGEDCWVIERFGPA